MRNGGRTQAIAYLLEITILQSTMTQTARFENDRDEVINSYHCNYSRNYTYLSTGTSITVIGAVIVKIYWTDVVRRMVSEDKLTIANEGNLAIRGR